MLLTVLIPWLSQPTFFHAQDHLPKGANAHIVLYPPTSTISQDTCPQANLVEANSSTEILSCHVMSRFVSFWQKAARALCKSRREETPQSCPLSAERMRNIHDDDGGGGDKSNE